MQLKGIIPGVTCFLYTCMSYAQEIPFVHYTPKDGLVNSRVRAAYQDSKGRMYFLTYGGLSVYDGARFSNYTTADGLADNLVNDVLEAGTDSILVATNTGQLNVLVKGKIKLFHTSNNFCPLINRFLRGDDGKLYALGDEGLYLFDHNIFTRLPAPGSSGTEAGKCLEYGISYKNYLLLFPWCLNTHASIIVYDLLRKKVTDSISLPLFLAVKKNPGEIWLSTAKGLRILDSAALNKGKLAVVVPSVHYNFPGKFIPRCLLFDAAGRTWCSGSNDLFKIGAGGEQAYYGKDQGFLAYNISGLFVDREGIAWILSNGAGLIKLVNANVEIQPGVVTAIDNAHYSDTTWFFNAARHSFYEEAPHFHRLYNLPGAPPDHFFLTPGRSLYFSRGNAVYKVSNKNKAGDYLHPEMIYQDALSAEAISAGLVDPYGNLLISSYGSPGEFRILAILGKKTFFRCKVRYHIDQMVIDKDKRLWITSRVGELKVFCIHPDQPGNYLELLYDYGMQIPPVRPRSLAVDADNNIWIGTREDGIYLFRLAGGQLQSYQHFTQKNGLTDNFIFHLTCDKHNNIWACTQEGLDRIFTSKGRYTIENVTKSKNIFFQTTYAVTDAAGTVWALTSAGNIIKATIADPVGKDTRPPLLLTGMFVNDSLFDPVSQPAVFAYNNNNLTFNVAAPSFIDEKQILYSYRLEGGNNTGWSVPLASGTFNILNLSPGSYRLQARADFPAASYPSQLLVYPFVIRPPWWQTWWFRLAGMIGAAIIILLVMRYYVNNKLERQRMTLEKKQIIEKERTRIATDLHDDLGAGLSSIRFIGEKIRRNTVSESAGSDIDRIGIASTELIDKMNEIIWAMNEKSDSLEDLLYYTRSYAMEYCDDNNLECDIRLPDPIPAAFVSGEMRRNIFLTIKESLHNIVKHAGAEKVTIHITIMNGLTVRIHDDGKGMDPAVKYRNEGNGLKNMQKRMVSIGGSMEILNGRGVTVEIKAPLFL